MAEGGISRTAAVSRWSGTEPLAELVAEEEVDVGGQLRFFGDGWQGSKVLGGRRHWRIPVMEGEFLVEERFGVIKGVAGGNLIVMWRGRRGRFGRHRGGRRGDAARVGAIMPFPGGIARSGSKVGSRYKALMASTNHPLCPTLREQVDDSEVPEGVNSIFEIVIDGLGPEPVRETMRAGLHAAAQAGARCISAGNYGGNLGKHHFHLRELL